MLSPDTTTGALGSTTKSVPVSMNRCASADCSEYKGTVKAVLTPATTRIVAKERNEIVVFAAAVVAIWVFFSLSFFEIRHIIYSPSLCQARGL